MNPNLLFGLTLFIASLFSYTSYAQAASSVFGVVGAVPSQSADSDKQRAVDMIDDLGMGWTRHEFTYQNPVDFAPYDAANAKLKARGIKTLGLLAYPGSDKSHDEWKSFVQSVVGHYGTDIAAWEIMNEADNYLSGSDYTTYLKEAHDIIKGINGAATIVLTGITSRPETPNFWNSVSAAGGWNYFDAAGLHVYHSGYPEKVNFGGGDLLAEYDRALASLKKNGGGKKIWITEMGYSASEVGNDNQANWLERTMIMSRSVSAIERIILYRLYDDSQATYGLTGANFSNRLAYARVKSVISQLGSAGIGTRLYPQDKKIVDSFDASAGWVTKATHNGTLALSSVLGKNSNALELTYNFTAEQAYAVAEKTIPISGTPQAIAAWIYGDDTKNVWKFRFKDAKGETFQTDLGTTNSGWSYKQFTIGQDAAVVSWDGDGKVDYPISFTAMVIDRQGGEAGGTGKVDDLTAITGGADLFVYQFGQTIAYWKTSGAATSTICKASREASEAPAYANGVDCTDTPVTAVATIASPTVAKTSPKPAVAASKSPAPVAVALPSPSIVASPLPTPSATLSPNPTTTPAVIQGAKSKLSTWWILGFIVLFFSFTFLIYRYIRTRMANKPK